MVWNILWPLMLIFSVVVLPMWLWRRMKSVQQAAREALDDEPARGEAAWEETTTSGDGLNYGRAQAYDPVLAKASRDAEHVDDIKNLEGRR
ncbi:hypothetical protein L7H23_00500 [Sphingopyxis sp. BSN-002]|uniref:hypothetical protein n=1 Tax=Sphingopyxis sp. BSN-002 TaxID=2911495 RepID=UPI001EDB31F1|nr:hypothetical protein [Sphingopyxis sp. BSN-002]UKK84625.1 hypothetical protein L7H23_00500 [Sphingopyxis sp. BSN-002]